MKSMKFFLSCLDDKIYILNNGYNGLGVIKKQEP